jgi:hypothetical protein
MLTVSNHSGQVEAGQRLSQKHICLRILVLVSLGSMVLAVFGLLPGCGSDSTPSGVVKGKNAPTATKSGTMKPQAVAPLFSDQEETGAGKKALVKKQPDSKHIEVFPGVTQEEVEAEMAANRTNPPQEVFPGVTLEEVEAEMAANRTNPPKEVFPGVTLEELGATVQAAGQKPDLELMMETFPGATQGKMD